MKTPWMVLSVCSLALAALLTGCASKPYGVETKLSMPQAKRQIWAVAPAINLSGESGVDPLLQADDLYQQLQQIDGLTVIPVNRVAELYAGLRIEKVQSKEQAAVVCDLLGCDALIVPTVTAFDPYDPPKLGAALQLFSKPGSYVRPQDIDPHDLVRQAAPSPQASLAAQSDFVQVVGMFDAANGSVRRKLFRYAAGRNDPKSPLGPREYLVSMDRYCGFVYSSLAAEMLQQLERPTQAVAATSHAEASPLSTAGAVSTAAVQASPSGSGGAPMAGSSGSGLTSSKTDFLK